jgi:hypothetical protein
MSTSACTENKKSLEGKFGFLKQKFEECEFETLPRFGPDNPGGQIGNPSFETARQKIKHGSPDIWKVNVAGIRENGKCRVVTAGSFYKDAFLQPFSHMTIEAVKCVDLLKDSLQAGRLGYTFISGVNHLDHIRGAILFEEEVYVMSFDWKKATDKPPHASGHLTMGSLLDAMNTPKDIKRDILAIWPGQKDIYVNGKNRGLMVNGIPMGDPLTKTNISLAHPICALYADKIVGKKIIRVGAGNGDDGVEIVAGPDAKLWMSSFLNCAQQLGYELSEDDFFITSDWFTYCEEVARIPIDRFNTCGNATRLKEDRLSPYLDFPKFRLVIDTRKDRKDYSSDPKGKYTLLGKDSDYVYNGKQMGVAHLFNVASAMQDICLGLKYEKIPVYIPRQIFSVGKLPSSWNPKSWAHAIMSQRRRQRELSYTILKEVAGILPPNLTKLKGVLSSETHFDSEKYVEIKTIPSDDPIRKFVVVRKEDWGKFPPGVLSRLRSTKRLVSESKIQAMYLFQERVQSLQQEIKADLFEVIAGMSFPTEDPTFDKLKLVCESVRNKFIGSAHLMYTLHEEDLYPNTIYETLRQSDPLRVDLPEFQYLNRFTKARPSDTPLERAVDELERWFYDNYEAILAGDPWDLPPRQAINDDDVMILAAERSQHVINIFVTDDIKLWKLAHNKLPSKEIMRISIHNWVNYDADEGSFLKAIKDRTGHDAEIHVDLGAMDTFLMKTDITPTKYPGWSDDVKRSEVRSQADIYDVYMSPRELNADNIFEVVKRHPLRQGPIGGALSLPLWRDV